MPLREQYVEQMRQALRIVEPDLDTTVGTVTRKILDVVAEVMAEVSVDRYLLGYQYDIDAKAGSDLDDFVRLFGFGRVPAHRATGTVVFDRQTPAPDNILIPTGTQLGTAGDPAVVVSTVVPALLRAGETTIEVPARAVSGGAEGNIPPAALRFVITPLNGISTATNPTAFIGGTNSESDEQLRHRFRRTIFRNLAGTAQMYEGVALEDESVSKVNVIGASKRHREQIEVVGGTATSTVRDARLVYANSSIFGPDIDTGGTLTAGSHYQFDHEQVPPVITVLNSDVVPDGIYDLEFEYVPWASRNRPEDRITNRVDVYVNGVRAVEASETMAFRTDKVFNDTDGDPLDVSRFERHDESQPQVGNFFLNYAFKPVLLPSLTDEIVIDGTTYEAGVDFFLVNDVTSSGGTPSSMSGIEWVSAANGAAKVVPDDETIFQVDYAFNAVPRDIQADLHDWRLVTEDAQVHQAKPVRLDLHLAAIYEPGWNSATLLGPIQDAVQDYLSLIQFAGVVQVSDLMAVVHNVDGVDAVRFLTSDDDPANFAIQRVNVDGDVMETFEEGGRAADVFLADDQIAVLNEIRLVTRAPNSFGIV